MHSKFSTKEEYLKRINIVIDYINNHLDEDIDLKKLASISHFSPFHFQRIMKAFLGEPLGSFIIRTRVETAAQLIRYTNLPLKDIAYRIGYIHLLLYRKFLNNITVFLQSIIEKIKNLQLSNPLELWKIYILNHRWYLSNPSKLFIFSCLEIITL